MMGKTKSATKKSTKDTKDKEANNRSDDHVGDFDDFLNSLGDNDDDGGDDDDYNGESDTAVVSSSQNTSLKQHKKSLQNLQQTDPDFFNFLKENDSGLLDFDDDEDDDDDEDEEEEEEEEEDPIHKPPDTLIIGSDSEEDELSGDEIDEVEGYLKKKVVNQSVIKYWQNKLSSPTIDLKTLKDVVDGFVGGVNSILEDTTLHNSNWNVNGSIHFNALIRLTLGNIQQVSLHYLCGDNEKKFLESPQHFISIEKNKKKWKGIRPIILSYIRGLVSFIGSMGSGSEGMIPLLRHSNGMSPLWSLLRVKSFPLMKELIKIWSTGEDSLRIASFLNIMSIINYNRSLFLKRSLKEMYMGYVANAKFTSINTWSSINFMRGSLVECLLLDRDTSYSVGFPFIRQLSIHLRNGIRSGTHPTSSGDNQQSIKATGKELFRIVYSWQFLHSLHLWTQFLSYALSTTSQDSIQLLLYPIVQICLGTMKLIPTRKYIPLRLHILNMLSELSEKTGVFIPLLPWITSILSQLDLKNESFSMQPLDIKSCLKANPKESGYWKGIIDGVYDSLIKILKGISLELSFPEIVTPSLIQIRNWTKHSMKNPQISKQFKTLISNIEAHGEFISKKRNKGMEEGNLNLMDLKSHDILRVQMKISQPPFISFLNQHSQKKTKKIYKETKEESLIPRPIITKSKSNITTTMELFPEDENEHIILPPPSIQSNKRKINSIKNKKTKKIKSKKADEDDDIVDLDLSD